MNIGLLSEILNTFIDGFSGGFERLRPIMGSLQHLLLALDVVWFGLMVLFDIEPLKGGLRKLLVWTLWTYVIGHFGELATAMVDSLVQAGLVAAGRGDVSPKIVMNPSLLMEGYFAATQPVADEVLKVKWYAINGTYMLFGFTLFMMWLAYFSLALNAIMAVTEYYLALTITGILMPFGVLGPTRWIAMKPVSYFLATGLKLMVIACLAAISRDLLGNIKFPDAEPTFRQMLVAFSSASTLGLLCWLAPQRLAAGIMAGATSMGPSDAVSVATNAARGVAPLAKPVAAAGKLLGKGLALGGLAAWAGLRGLANRSSSSGGSVSKPAGNSAALAKMSPVASAVTARGGGGAYKPVFDGEFVESTSTMQRHGSAAADFVPNPALTTGTAALPPSTAAHSVLPPPGV